VPENNILPELIFLDNRNRQLAAYLSHIPMLPDPPHYELS
jgi:hypothetical protein